MNEVKPIFKSWMAPLYKELTAVYRLQRGANSHSNQRDENSNWTPVKAVIRKTLSGANWAEQSWIFILWEGNSLSYCWSNCYQEDINCLIPVFNHKYCPCRDARQQDWRCYKPNWEQGDKNQCSSHLVGPCFTNITRMLMLVATVQWVGIIAARP